MFSSVLSAIPDVGEVSGELSKALSLILSFLGSGEGSPTNALNNLLSGMTTTQTYFLAGLSLAFALLGCFSGYKLCRLFMTITGFFAGLIVGAIVGINVLKASNGIVILCAVIGALLLSIFAFKIYQAGIFLLCFFLAFTASVNVIPLQGTILLFVCVVIGFVAGTLALKYVRPVIILVSALTCAYSASRHMMVLGPLTGLAFFKEPYARLAIFAGLFLFGSVIQFVTTRDEDFGKKDKKRR